MQKKLIALAVAAAFSAPAFADVTMYGNVDAGVIHSSADGLKSDFQAVSGGLSPSRLGVKGAEDLGNGMKAVVVLEYGLDNATNSAIGSVGAGTANSVARQQMLALAGDWGTVATGLLQTTGYDWAMKFDPTAESAVSPLQTVTKGFVIGSNTVGARAQRALAYISPDMGGVTVAVNYSTSLTGIGDLGTLSTAAIQDKSTAALVSATYNGGPLSVGVVYAGATLGNTYLQTVTPATYTSTLSTTDIALGASYDFTVVKLFGTYQTSKTGTNNIVTVGSDNKAYSLGVVAPVGPGAIAFSYAKNSIGTNGTLAGLTHVGTGTDQNANGYTVAWLQGLSKTTTFYAAVNKVSQGVNTAQYSTLNNALAGGQAGGGSTLLAVGLNKKF